jgi:hypothetical protein
MSIQSGSKLCLLRYRFFSLCFEHYPVSSEILTIVSKQCKPIESVVAHTNRSSPPYVFIRITITQSLASVHICMLIVRLRYSQSQHDASESVV